MANLASEPYTGNPEAEDEFVESSQLFVRDSQGRTAAAEGEAAASEGETGAAPPPPEGPQGGLTEEQIEAAPEDSDQVDEFSAGIFDE